MNTTITHAHPGQRASQRLHAGIARQPAAETYETADQACPRADTQSGPTCDRSGSPANETITGESACIHGAQSPLRLSRRFGREDVDSASGPASPVLRWYGRRVGSLGPGLTSESADAVSGCPANDLSAGSQVFRHPPACRSDLPGLGKRPGFTGPAASGCVPSLNHRKGMAMTIVEDTRHHRRRGHPRRHARRRRAGSRSAGCSASRSSRPPRPATPACWAGWAGSGPSPWSGSRAPAATAPAWPATSPRPASGSSRWTAPTGRTAAGRASPIRWMRSARPGPPSPAGPAARRRAATARWRRSGR